MVLNYFNNPTILVISAIVMVMALILHNIVQTYVAAKFGDTRAKFSGFDRFDPQKQLEPFGVLFLFLLGFGWPKAIPTESRNYRGRGRQEMWVWYAGPLTYLGVALVSYIVGALLLNFGGQQELFRAFAAAGDFAIVHAVINLFPVYPLDGAKAALAWGNPEVRRFIQQVAQYGFIGFIVIFMLLSYTGVTGAIIGFFRNLILGILNLIF